MVTLRNSCCTDKSPAHLRQWLTLPGNRATEGFGTEVMAASPAPGLSVCLQLAACGPRPEKRRQRPRPSHSATGNASNWAMKPTGAQ